jgi:hypothetical protein
LLSPESIDDGDPCARLRRKTDPSRPPRLHVREDDVCIDDLTAFDLFERGVDLPQKLLIYLAVEVKLGGGLHRHLVPTSALVAGIESVEVSVLDASLNVSGTLTASVSWPTISGVGEPCEADQQQYVCDTGLVCGSFFGEIGTCE